MNSKICKGLCGERKNIDEFQQGQSICIKCSRIIYYKQRNNGIVPLKVCVICKEEKLIIGNFTGNNKICLKCIEELEHKECLWCQKCEKEKPMDEFYTSVYFSTTCIECQIKFMPKPLPVKECKKLLRKYLNKIDE